MGDSASAVGELIIDAIENGTQGERCTVNPKLKAWL